MRELCETAVEAALGAGAVYADARAVIRRSQQVLTKNRKVESVTDAETEGIGTKSSCDRSERISRR